VPGEQPRIANLVKLNTNESPFGPFAARGGKRCEPQRWTLCGFIPILRRRSCARRSAVHHGVKPEQVFVGNGSDEVLRAYIRRALETAEAAAFSGPHLQLLSRVGAIVRPRLRDCAVGRRNARQGRGLSARAGSIVIANPNAPTGVALPRAEIARLLEDHPDIPVVIDEAYVDFGGESAVPLIADHPNLLVVQTMSKSRALAGLRVGYALGGVGLIEALHRVKNSFNSYPLGRLAQAGATASVHDDAYFHESCARVVAGREAMTRELIRLGFVVLPSSANFRLRQASGAGRAGIRGGVARTCGAGAALQQAALGALSAYHRRDGGRRATANRGGGCLSSGMNSGWREPRGQWHGYGLSSLTDQVRAKAGRNQTPSCAAVPPPARA